MKLDERIVSASLEVRAQVPISVVPSLRVNVGLVNPDATPTIKWTTHKVLSDAGLNTVSSVLAAPKV
jgi:hypothetical protein